MTEPRPRLFIFVYQHTAARFIMADFAAAFAAAGFPVHFSDFCPLLRLPDGPDRQARLADELARAAAFAPDLLVAYGMEAFVPFPGAGELFARFDLPTLNLFFDFFDWDAAKLRAHPLFEHMCGPDCHYLCWDRLALARLRADGFARAGYLALGVNPATFHCLAPVGPARPLPVSFIGIATAERVRCLEPLAELGLEIYGPGANLWQDSAALRARYRGAQNDRVEVNRYYNNSYMTVNITQAHGTDSLNMRVYEALSAGCLLLTDDKPVLREHFRPGEELVLHRGDDLAEVARYFLAHPDEGTTIAKRGLKAVRARHTYARRVAEIAALLPLFLRQRTAYRGALAQLGRGEWRAGWSALRLLDEADEPFGNPEHLLFYCGIAAWQAGDRAAGEKYFSRLAAVNPASPFLKKISR